MGHRAEDRARQDRWAAWPVEPERSAEARAHRDAGRQDRSCGQPEHRAPEPRQEPVLAPRLPEPTRPGQQPEPQAPGLASLRRVRA